MKKRLRTYREIYAQPIGSLLRVQWTTNVGSLAKAGDVKYVIVVGPDGRVEPALPDRHMRVPRRSFPFRRAHYSSGTIVHRVA